MIRIRPAEHRDLSLIQTLYTSVLDQSTRIESLERSLERENVLLLVATNDVALCGFAHAIWSGGPWELLGLVVNTDFRRLGVGTLLMTNLLDCLEKIENTTLWLEVRADNETALSFYKRTGARVTGGRSRYYKDGVDAILMSYALGESG